MLIHCSVEERVGACVQMGRANALISFLVPIAILVERAITAGHVVQNALEWRNALVMDDATEPRGLVCA